MTFLCLASYFKGNRFLERCKAEGSTVYLLTIESVLKEPWARYACDNVFAVNNFQDRRTLVNVVAYLMRTRAIDRIVALDDFDIEVAAFLREHFRMTGTGHGETAVRHFRDKLAMRQRARELDIRIPEFVPIFNHDAVRTFLAKVPPPWLVKPRSEASAAGIRKLHHADDVWRRIDELGDDQSFHLIEQMVPGDLYHVDSLAANNTVVFAEVNAYWRPLLERLSGRRGLWDPHRPARPSGSRHTSAHQCRGARGFRTRLGGVAHRVHEVARRWTLLLHRNEFTGRRRQYRRDGRVRHRREPLERMGQAGTLPRD